MIFFFICGPPPPAQWPHSNTGASKYIASGTGSELFNTLKPEQNGCHFADNIFRCILLNDNFHIPIWISLKFVAEGWIDNKSALIQVMFWQRTGTNHYLNQHWPRVMKPYDQNELIKNVINKISQYVYWLIDRSIAWSTDIILWLL